MTCILDFVDLVVKGVQYDTFVKDPVYTPTLEYSAEHCIDSDQRTSCKSSNRKDPKYPSAIKLELQGSFGHQIKSVTIYSPVLNKVQHGFKVQV